MSPKEKKVLAKNLFLHTELSRKAIAEQVGCTEKTLRHWIEKENWQAVKTAQTITRAQLIQQAYAQLQAINKKIDSEFNGVPNKELSDAKAVIRKEIEALAERPLHQYIEVMIDFTLWLQKHHNEQLKATLTLTDEFINERIKDESH